MQVSVAKWFCLMSFPGNLSFVRVLFVVVLGITLSTWNYAPFISSQCYISKIIFRSKILPFVCHKYCIVFPPKLLSYYSSYVRFRLLSNFWVILIAKTFVINIALYQISMLGFNFSPNSLFSEQGEVYNKFKKLKNVQF